MKKLLSLTAVLTTALILTACASNPAWLSWRSRKENNQFEVTGVGKSNLIAKNNAVEAANKTCGNKATAVITDEKTEYNGALKGVVDEKTGQMIQAAAGVLGSITGKSTGLNSDEDYQTILNFYCKTK